MARNTPPTGIEVAEQARQIRFDDSRSVDATRAKDKVHVRFTPPSFEQPKTKEELEAGVVLGRVQLELGSYQGLYRARLQSGTHHLFLAKVGGTWKGYAEFKGAIALEAKEVTVEEGSSLTDIKQDVPKVEFGSICFSDCWIITIAFPIPIWPYEIAVAYPYCWTWCL
jgi:hypothetical protein